MGIIKKIKMRNLKTPWTKFYKKEDLEFDVGDKSIYEALIEASVGRENLVAINYLGRKITYKEFINKIDKVANCLKFHGIKKGDVVTICMPNVPEGIISYYAINKIGAISNMVHPLSSEEEIKEYLVSTKSVMLIVIDKCYDKISKIIKETNVYRTIIVSAKDSMPLVKGLGYTLSTLSLPKMRKIKNLGNVIGWKEFLLTNFISKNSGLVETKKDDPATILHSGGTTGKPKGIILSDGNFNSLAKQITIVLDDLKPGDKVLAIMPIFHGFGLGVSMVGPFILGCEVIMVPQFNSRKFDLLLEEYKPNVILGVPTLYEALINTKNDKLDLSMLKHAICGGDSMNPSLIRRVNLYLEQHGAKIKVSQGFGMTESLAAVCLSNGEAYREGSIGIPFPGDYIKIVKPETQEDVPFGEDGEICVSGPTVMLGYLDNEKETNEMLQIHKDGLLWLHTGDIGMMTEEGIIYYRQRLKRMIISSGYNVYPSYVEEVIEEHPAVLNCTVVGISHPYKIEVPKAYIVLKNDYSATLGVKNSIKEHCKKNLASYSIPYEFEFRKSLPKTLIGKVDFNKLRSESENNERIDVEDE